MSNKRNLAHFHKAGEALQDTRHKMLLHLAVEGRLLNGDLAIFMTEALKASGLTMNLNRASLTRMILREILETRDLALRERGAQPQ